MLETKVFSVSVPADCVEQLQSNKNECTALLLYPLVKRGKLCIENVAALVEMTQLELFTYYGKLGFSVSDLTEEELQNDIENIKEFLTEKEKKLDE